MRIPSSRDLPRQGHPLLTAEERQKRHAEDEQAIQDAIEARQGQMCFAPDCVQPPAPGQDYCCRGCFDRDGGAY